MQNRRELDNVANLKMVLHDYPIIVAEQAGAGDVGWNRCNGKEEGLGQDC